MLAFPDDRENIEFYVVGIKPDGVAINLTDATGSVLLNDPVNIAAPLQIGLASGTAMYCTS